LKDEGSNTHMEAKFHGMINNSKGTTLTAYPCFPCRVEYYKEKLYAIKEEKYIKPR
jgi:hypothetical protein